jgi:hypothetical protein
MWKTGTTSVSSNVTIQLVQAISEQKELYVPMTLISKTHLKTIETTAVVNSRAVGTFISEDFIKLQTSYDPNPSPLKAIQSYHHSWKPVPKWPDYLLLCPNSQII